MGFLSRIEFAITWDRALRLAAANRQLEALMMLNSVGSPFAEDLEVKTLRLSLQWQSKDFEAVVNSSDLVLKKICADKRRRPMDLRYLHAFVMVLSHSAKAAVGGAPYDVFPLDILDWSKIDLDGVSKHFKSNFPLRTHPSWSE